MNGRLAQAKSTGCTIARAKSQKSTPGEFHPSLLKLTTGSLAKPSKPSRAYIHVTQQIHVTALGDHVREATFHDAAKSFQDGALVGPPVLEFAPYPKMPSNRRKNDARQGTIDQDPEFKEFLESLTAPIVKPAAPEGEPQKEEKVKTTPLIEALREKKANKEKPQGKKGRGEPKEDGAEKKILAKPGKDALASGDKNRRISKAEREKAQKEAAKALNKEASALKDATGGPSTDKAASGATPAPDRKRGNVNLAKSMLQRDLGIGPAPNRRRGTKREVTAATQDAPAQADDNATGKQKAKEAVSPAAAVAASEKTVAASPKKERPSRAERRAFKASLADKTNNKPAGEDSKAQTKPAATPAPTILKKPHQPAQTPTPPKGPAATRVPPTEPAAARNAPAPSQAMPAKQEATSATRPANPTTPQGAPASPAPAPTSKQAFLKHANASQGITEPLIEDALKVYGAIERVEIDKRKGFAYVDFVEPEGLQKAIAASPVKVAQGAVQVLERKEKVARARPFAGPPTGPARGRGGFGPRGRGGRGGARGGAHAVPSAAPTDGAPVPAAPAPAGDAAT